MFVAGETVRPGILVMPDPHRTIPSPSQFPNYPVRYGHNARPILLILASHFRLAVLPAWVGVCCVALTGKRLALHLCRALVSRSASKRHSPPALAPRHGSGCGALLPPGRRQVLVNDADWELCGGLAYQAPRAPPPAQPPTRPATPRKGTGSERLRRSGSGSGSGSGSRSRSGSGSGSGSETRLCGCAGVTCTVIHGLLWQGGRVALHRS